MRLIAYQITYLEVLERVDNLFTPIVTNVQKYMNKIVLCKNSTKDLNGNTMGFYPQT